MAAPITSRLKSSAFLNNGCICLRSSFSLLASVKSI
jgi:hypothetical protein